MAAPTDTPARRAAEAPAGHRGESRVFKVGDGLYRQQDRFWWDACPECGQTKWRRKPQVGKLCATCNAARTTAACWGERE